MRKAAAAGRFYPGDEDALGSTVRDLLRDAERRDGSMTIAPHAGYPYSGGLAARSCAALRDSDTYVLIGPNHTGRGEPVALSAETWRTPLGDVPVDRDAVDATDLPVDEAAHAREHSIEVQLPLLQELRDDFSILPICMKDQGSGAVDTVADAVEPMLDDAALLASSDLTHYAPLDAAEKRDRAFLDRVLDLDTTGVLEAARTGSQCGSGPVAVATTVAERRGLEPELLGYGTSADATGDVSSVVGYGSVMFQ